MRSRGGLHAGLIASAVLLRAISSHAQDQNYQQALAAFQRGLAALDAHRPNDAIVAFEEARRLRTSAGILTNLGVAYREAGRLRDAMRAFREFQTLTDVRITETDRARVRREIEILASQLGLVRVVILPSGLRNQVRVFLDGESFVLGMESVPVDPGSRVFEAEADGFPRVRASVDARSGQESTVLLELRAAQRTGILRVNASVSGSVVLVDGTVQANEAVLSVGTHQVEVRADGYTTFSRTVTLTEGGLVEVRAELLRVEVTPTPTTTRSLPGWVIPVSISAGAAVVLGGVIAGIVVATSTPRGQYEGNGAGTWLGNRWEMR